MATCGDTSSGCRQGRAAGKTVLSKALPLRVGGVLIYIVPHYVLDAELVGWLTRHFADLRIYRAVGSAVQTGGDLRPPCSSARPGIGFGQGHARAAAADRAGDAEAEGAASRWPFTAWCPDQPSRSRTSTA